MKTQEELRQAHGTPVEFAQAVFKAVGGEISIDEAEAAIDEYREEWRKAGRNDFFRKN
jgi:hypothetical protein